MTGTSVVSTRLLFYFPPTPDKRSLQTHQWGCAEGYCKVVWRAVRLVKCFFAIEAGTGGPHDLLRGRERRRGAAYRRTSGRRQLLRAEAQMRAAQHPDRLRAEHRR